MGGHGFTVKTMEQEVVELVVESCRVSLQCVDMWENISALSKKDCMPCSWYGRIDGDPGSRWWGVMTFSITKQVYRCE